MATKKLAAEFVGTFWLVLGGCGSAVLAAAFPEVGIGLLGVSLAFGEAIERECAAVLGQCEHRLQRIRRQLASDAKLREGR